MGNTKPYIDMRKLKVLGIAAGVGSCLFTFHKRRNFEVIGNVEPRAVFHTKKEEQWKLNFGNIPFERSIEPYLKKMKPDIIIGHPDCGDSSILRMSRAKKKGDVKANPSVNLFLNSINHYQPSVFLLENLSPFLESHPLESLNDMFFERYSLIAIQGSVSLWGNSQVSRKRLVVIGVLKSNKVAHLDGSKLVWLCNQFQSLGQHRYSSLKMAETFELGREELPEIAHYRELPSTFVSMYHPPTQRRKITFENAEQIWKQLGTNVQRWPVGGKMKSQPGVSKHVSGKPPLTVRKQNRQFGTLGLVLSPREMANIQGFPISFRLFVDLNQRVYWLNKNRVAVTKCPPYEISKWFKKVIKKSIR